MKKLKWDNELAAGAKVWAEQCYSDNQNAHDNDFDRRVCRFSVGQNKGIMTMRSSAGNVKIPANWKDTVQRWYDEVADFRGDVSSLEFQPSAGHFTQVGNTDIDT